MNTNAVGRSVTMGLHQNKSINSIFWQNMTKGQPLTFINKWVLTPEGEYDNKKLYFMHLIGRLYEMVLEL